MVPAAYLAAQAAATIAWWFAMLVSSSLRSHFELASHDHRILTAFWFPDLAVFVSGSLVAAFSISRNRSLAFAATMSTAGASTYATLYLASWVASGGSDSLGLLAMGPATAATAGIAFQLQRSGG